jgi:hypothetical protein
MMHSTFPALAFGILLVGCSGKTLEPIAGAPDSGTGGSTGGSGGSTGGSGGSTGGSSGSGGVGGTNDCVGPNPAGCQLSGCQSGFVCETTATCIPSSCTCGNGTWNCSEDCGGGQCMLDASGSVAAVRIGFVQGQESTGEFCVAYEKAGNGDPVWSSSGLLAAGGFTPPDVSGMDKITRYIGLSQKPVAFGKSYTSDCSQVAAHAFVETSASHFTVISVPFSGEPDTLWIVSDPGPGDSSSPGLRIVNATAESHPIDVTIDGVDVGTFQFGTASDEYEITVANNHVTVMEIETSPGATTHVSFAGLDLLPAFSTTIYVSGGALGPAVTLSCFDRKPVLTGAQFSDCWLVEGSSP